MPLFNSRTGDSLALHRLLGQAVRDMVGSTCAARFAVMDLIVQQFPKTLMFYFMKKNLAASFAVWVPYIQAVLGEDMQDLCTNMEDSWRERGQSLVAVLNVALMFQTFFGGMRQTLSQLGQCASVLARRYLEASDPLSLAVLARYAYSTFLWQNAVEGERLLKAELARHEPYFDPLDPLMVDCRLAYATVALNSGYGRRHLEELYVAVQKQYATLHNKVFLMEAIRMRITIRCFAGNFAEACQLADTNKAALFDIAEPVVVLMAKIDVLIASQLFGDAARTAAVLPWRDEVLLAMDQAKDLLNAHIVAKQAAHRNETELCLTSLMSCIWFPRNVGKAD